MDTEAATLTACGRAAQVLLRLAPRPWAGPAPRFGLPVFRVRVSGPSGVWRQPVLVCDESLALSGPIELSQPGAHSIEVVLIYPDFSICEIGAATHASNATYDLPSGTPPPSPWLGFLLATPDLADPSGTPVLAWSTHPPRLGRALSTNSKGADGTVRKDLRGPGDAEPAADALVPAPSSPQRCAPYGLRHGRWVFAQGWNNAARSLAEGLRQSCMFMPSSLSHPKYACRRGDLQRNASGLGLTWRPDGGCAVPVYTELERQACLARLDVGPGKGKLCFLGDSHSRFLSHALNDWATNTSATRAEWYLNKAAPPEDYVQCVADPWGSLPAGTASLRNCSVIVANTGQWQASYNTKAAPQNVTQYASNLRHWLGRVVDAARARRVPVLYALTVARPLQWQMFVGQDWRTDIILEHYNFAAVQIAAELGIPVLDTWAASTNLPESTIDQSHFLWRGAVGGVIRDAVIHGICSTIEGPVGTPQQQRRERA